ncbi:MAG: sodium:solute symporter, partial [Candidatus Methylomirabilales bacterium]
MITGLDYTILVLYFVGLIGLSVFLGRRFVDLRDFYLGSRRIPAWAISASIMATQAGVISMISAPAFVALRPGGGLIWLQYEFAVPLAMILIMAVLVPFFYQAEVITVYEYLERRFDVHTRTLLSVVFQISRGLATGVSIYAAGILLSVVLETPLWISILLTGVIALAYTAIGGIAAVIWSDVIQLVILWGGIFVVMGYAISVGGGWTAVVSHIPLGRFQAVDFTSHGFGDAETFSFWPMVIGGFFLYASYYGCDQSQMQRTLSSASVEESRRALWYNGLLRFPLVLSYTLVGLVMAGFVIKEPQFTATIPPDHLDYLIPLFIKRHVPTGLTGLILAGMFAAVMSSIDSAFNSLSAASVQDLYVRYLNPHASDRQYLLWSRATTVLWGVVCTGFAFLVQDLAPTVIEGINKIGSVFYGPILAAFLLAILSRRATSRGVFVGLLTGVGINLILWLGFEPAVSWLWWNLTGCVVTLGAAYAVSLRDTPPRPEQLKGLIME